MSKERHVSSKNPLGSSIPRLEVKLPRAKIIDFQSRLRQAQETRADRIVAAGGSVPVVEETRGQKVVRLKYYDNPAVQINALAPQPRNRAERRSTAIQFEGKKVSRKRWERIAKDNKPEESYGAVHKFVRNPVVQAGTRVAAAAGTLIAGGVVVDHLHNDMTPTVSAQGIDDGTALFPPTDGNGLDVVGASFKGPLAVPEDVPVADSSGSVLLADNFDDSDSGVLPKRSSDPRVELGYVDGEYALRVVDPSVGIARVSLGTQTDSRVSVDARFAGDDTSKQIIEIRSRKQANANSDYRFGLQNGGRQFVLLRWEDGRNGATLVSGNVPADLFRVDGNYHIEINYVGSNIFVKVNGKVIASVQDSAFDSGETLIVANGNGGLADVRLDNLEVTEPDPNEPVPKVGQSNSESTTTPKSPVEFIGTDVSEVDRRLIEEIVPWTQNYWGEEAGSLTVYAFRDINSLIEHLVPKERLSGIIYELELESITTAPGLLLIHVSDRWANFSEYTKLQMIIHSQFHSIERNLARDHVEPVWLGEGGAEYSMVRVMAKNGKLDLKNERTYIMREAGSLAYSLNMLEDWSTISIHRAPYAIGYLAVEQLVERFGEQAILSYWKEYGLTRGQNWQKAFENTFGMSIESFYNDFNTYITQIRDK